MIHFKGYEGYASKKTKRKKMIRAPGMTMERITTMMSADGTIGSETINLAKIDLSLLDENYQEIASG